MFLDKYRLMYFDANNDDGGSVNDEQPTNDGDDAGNRSESRAAITWTPEQQQEINRIVGERLERERNKIRREIEREMTEAARRAEMTEVERLKTELAELQSARDKMAAELDSERIALHAQIVALQRGVKPENISAVLKLASDALASIEVVDGKPDVAGIADAIESVIKTYPVFKTGVGNADAGARDEAGALDTETIGKLPVEEYARLRREGKIR